MEMKFNYQNQEITFNLIYRRRKTMEIRLDPPEKVTVIAPVGVSREMVLEKVRGKAPWLIQKINIFKEQGPVKRDYTEGNMFMYLGQNYPLRLKLSKGIKEPMVMLNTSEICVTTPSTDQVLICQSLERWFRAEALRHVLAKVNYYQRYFNIAPSGVRVKEQKTIWGSCTGRNELLFNWRCVMAPSEVLDYLVVHEMCHLVHRNHGKEYWQLVGSIIPNYKWCREWLKMYGWQMTLPLPF